MPFGHSGPRAHSPGNPTNFTKKSKILHKEIQKISPRNPKKFTEKFKKFHWEIPKWLEHSRKMVVKNRTNGQGVSRSKMWTGFLPISQILPIFWSMWGGLPTQRGIHLSFGKCTFPSFIHFDGEQIPFHSFLLSAKAKKITWLKSDIIVKWSSKHLFRVLRMSFVVDIHKLGCLEMGQSLCQRWCF